MPLPLNHIVLISTIYLWLEIVLKMSLCLQLYQMHLCCQIYTDFFSGWDSAPDPFWPNLLRTYSAARPTFSCSTVATMYRIFWPLRRKYLGLLQPLLKRKITSAVCEWGGVLIFLIGTFFHIRMLIILSQYMHVHHLVCSFCRVILKRSYYLVI